MISTSGLVIILIAIVIGSMIQSAVGFGVGVVAGPVIAMITPELVPVSLLIMGIVLSLPIMIRYRVGIDLPGVSWAFLGRLAGMLAGGYMLIRLSTSQIGFLVAITVIMAVVLSYLPLKIPKNRQNLMIAGALSGFSGTSAGIGGPPLALIYSKESGQTVRASLAIYLLAGCTLSLIYLTYLGAITWEVIRLSFLLSPASLVGYYLSGPFRAWVDGGWVRSAVAVVSILSALGLVVKTLFVM